MNADETYKNIIAKALRKTNEISAIAAGNGYWPVFMVFGME